MSKALALALACHGAAAWTASDASIRSAVRLWLSDKSAAEVKYGHISTWETGGVTDMDFLFCVRAGWMDEMDENDFLDSCVLPASASSFNDGISAWDTSSVTTMKGMFHGASAFNQPLGDWRVDKVINMNSMFWEASSFNRPLGSWMVDEVKDMGVMFFSASAFNQPLNDWRVDKVTNMNGMFWGAKSFNHPIGGWRVDKVTSMVGTFYNALSFDQPIGDWRVDQVTDMSWMFREAKSFNQPLNDWRVGNVTNMHRMFHKASLFNQPLGAWNVDKVKDMHGMFYKAKGFRQDLGWCVNDDVNMKYAFQKSRCECTSCGVMQKKRHELEQWVYTGKSYTLLMVFAICFVGASLPVREIKILRPRCQSPAHWLNLAQVARGARGERRDIGGSLLPNASTLQRRGKRRRGNRDVGLISRYGVEFSRRDDPFDAPCIPNDSTTSKSL